MRKTPEPIRQISMGGGFACKDGNGKAPAEVRIKPYWKVRAKYIFSKAELLVGRRREYIKARNDYLLRKIDREKLTGEEQEKYVSMIKREISGNSAVDLLLLGKITSETAQNALIDAIIEKHDKRPLETFVALWTVDRYANVMGELSQSAKGKIASYMDAHKEIVGEALTVRA